MTPFVGAGHQFREWSYVLLTEVIFCSQEQCTSVILFFVPNKHQTATSGRLEQRATCKNKQGLSHGAESPPPPPHTHTHTPPPPPSCDWFGRYSLKISTPTVTFTLRTAIKVCRKKIRFVIMHHYKYIYHDCFQMVQKFREETVILRISARNVTLTFKPKLFAWYSRS